MQGSLTFIVPGVPKPLNNSGQHDWLEKWTMNEDILKMGSFCVQCHVCLSNGVNSMIWVFFFQTTKKHIKGLQFQDQLEKQISCKWSSLEKTFCIEIEIS